MVSDKYLVYNSWFQQRKIEIEKEKEIEFLQRIGLYNDGAWQVIKKGR